MCGCFYLVYPYLSVCLGWLLPLNSKPLSLCWPLVWGVGLREIRFQFGTKVHGCRAWGFGFRFGLGISDWHQELGLKVPGGQHGRQERNFGMIPVRNTSELPKTRLRRYPVNPKALNPKTCTLQPFFQFPCSCLFNFR